MWLKSSDPSVFAARRERLARKLRRPAVFFAGRARARNFAANRYPFRAESHFLYFVGKPLEGAALVLAPERSTLYAEPPDPEEALWSGPMPKLTDLERELGVEVRPLDELRVPDGAATLPVHDAPTAEFQSDVLGRDVPAASGRELSEPDDGLAELVIEQRLVHDAGAIEQMRQAGRVTCAAHLAGMRATRPGVREALVLSRMETEIVERGCTHAYGPIVTTHGEVLHDERHDRELPESGLLLADVGAETPEGWASDVTRTWPTNGRFSPSQRELYDAVLEAQRVAIAAVKPGVRYLDVHRAAGKALLAGLIALGIYRGEVEDLYARGAAALFFPHGVGHLIGLDVHDMEDLGDRAGYAKGRTRISSFGDRYLRLDRDLEAGMAVTIEPGFYRIPMLLEHPEEVGDLEGALDRTVLARYADVRGIRIEDDVLVTETGADVLTASVPKTANDVETAVRG
ncbi:MAG TPA: aminopeptidase P family protein [Polyangiaceae bacterium]